MLSDAKALVWECYLAVHTFACFKYHPAVAEAQHPQCPDLSVMHVVLDFRPAGVLGWW